MKIGSKIYYDTVTGDVILITEERYGSVVETTKEHDFKVYAPLAKRDPDTVDMLQLEFGAYSEDYALGGIITHVDLETMEPLFTYPDPNDPETPPEPVPALSSQVDEMKKENGELKQAVAELSLVLAALMGGGE